MQDNEVLLKESTIQVTGKMPGNSPPETGSNTFIDSGQINVPENPNEMDVLGFEDNTEYIYYTKDGFYLGGKENSPRVYLCTQVEYEVAQNEGKWSLINFEEKLLKEKGRILSNSEFSNTAYLIYHEASLTGNKLTALWISHTVNNALSHSKYKRGKSTMNQLFLTGYSSVLKEDKLKKIGILNNPMNTVFARFALIDVLTNCSEPTSSSYFWDGLDLFTKEKELRHPKFKQYKSVTIYSAHLEEAIKFWSIHENKRKVNPKSKINTIFKSYYKLKEVENGLIKNDECSFLGKRFDSQDNPKITEHLISTGFQSGTMFWTTSKDDK